MGNSDHGTAYTRVGGDDGELRPWRYVYEGRTGRWGIPTMALHLRIQHSPVGCSVEAELCVFLSRPEELVLAF